jgi:hypothetical protein
MRTVPGLVAFLVLAAAGSAAAAVPVTTCGHVVTRASALAGDLDCTAFAGDAVVIARGRTLNLNGFTLKAHPDHRAVKCESPCRVVGGTIASGRIGVDSAPPAHRRMRIDLDRVTITGTGVAANGSHKILVKSSTISGNGSGVAGTGNAMLVRSTISNSAGNGVEGGKVTLVDSSVTGSGAVAEPFGCAPLACDILSILSPAVKGTSSCGQSCRNGNCVPWGVCSGD